MPRRGKQMSYSERLACSQWAAQGKGDAEIAQAMGWSVWAVRKWRRRYQQQGEQSLVAKLGRPKKGVMSTYPAALRTRLEQLRRGHPGWGPITLLRELARQPGYGALALPSRARVAAWLKEQHLVRAYQPRPSFPAPSVAPSAAAHAVWEMDAQGRQLVDGLGQVSVVNIIDVFSRLKVASYPHVWTRGLTWLDYQLVLRCAFAEYGLPQVISLDHDSAFFDSTCPSPFPARLHLWLLGLGIGVVFIHKPPPSQHARIERMHQTMSAQTLTGQSWHQQTQLWHGLDDRRNFLNLVYPSRSLQGQAPLQAFPQAIHSAREYRPEWETELFDLQRVDAFLAQGHWLRETSKAGEFFVGAKRYSAGSRWARSVVELSFDPATRELLAQKVGTGLVLRFPILGLTQTDLMGELPPFQRLPVYQFLLPFSHEVWRKDHSWGMLTGTTL